MTINDYARVLKQGWAYIAAAFALGIGVAVMANGLLPAVYRSDTTIYVTSFADGDYNIAASQVALARMPSYQQLVSDDRVLEEVASYVGGPGDTPAALRSQLAVTAEPETLLLKISVTDASPERAALIANTVADTYLRVVRVLEEPLSRDQVPIVIQRRVQQAETPTIPIGPRPTLNLALGGLVGLIGGVAAAFVRSSRGRKITSVTGLNTVLRVPSLGTITRNRATSRAPLLAPDSPAPRWDEHRQLATNLQLIDITTDRAVVMTSARSAAGTTTTACNLAIALAAAGRSVALVDADLRKSDVADLMAVDRTVGLTTVLTAQVPLSKAMHRWDGDYHVDVLASGAMPPNPGAFLDSDQMSVLITELRERYDVILFNSPSLESGDDAAVLAAKVDGALLVCRSHRVSSRDIAVAVETLEAAAVRILGTVFTFASRRDLRSATPLAGSDPTAPYRQAPPNAAPSQVSPDDNGRAAIQLKRESADDRS